MVKNIEKEFERIREHFNEDLYEKYINGETTFREIAKTCNVSENRLLSYFHLNHIKTRQVILNETTQHDFFQNIDSEIKAYLLGFYLADGSMDDINNRVTISVSEQDEYIIYLYKKYISSYYKITKTKASTNKKTGYTSKPMLSINFKSKIICEQLKKYGMGSRKTHNTNISIDYISDDLFIHFVRGYFDGDGTVCASKGQRKIKEKTYSYVNYNWSIISHKKEHLEKIKIRLETLFNLHINLINDKRGNFLIEINRKSDFFKMRNILYNNANFFLPRKKDKYMAIPC